MVNTTFTAQTGLHAQQFLSDVWKEQNTDSFFTRFIKWGEENDFIQGQELGEFSSISARPVQEIRKLDGHPGLKVTFSQIALLEGAGVTSSSGTRLKGNEEALRAYSHSVEIEGYHNAVVDTGDLGRLAVMWSDRPANKALTTVPRFYQENLSAWCAANREAKAIEALETAPTTVLYAGMRPAKVLLQLLTKSLLH